MQKVDNNNTSEKIIYSKKEKIIENYAAIGQMQNGCWTSRASNIKDADAINIKVNPNTRPCVCPSGTAWMLISDSTQTQEVYGCNPIPPSYSQFLPSDNQIAPSKSHFTPSDRQNMYTPSDRQNMYTPSDRQNMYTPSDNQNMYTPSDNQNMYTPSDSQNMYAPSS